MQYENVQDFTYLGSTIEASGKLDLDVNFTITKAFKTFGALLKAVFEDNNMTTLTKHKVYDACVLPTLLYASESWTPLKIHFQKLNSFYNGCLWLSLGISITTQWENRISNSTIRQRWGDPDTVNINVLRQHVQWLGHLA